MPGVDPTIRSKEWDVVLRDGSTAHVKPYEPGDADRVRRFLSLLSPESLRLRFFGRISPQQFDLETLASTTPSERYTLLAEGPGGVLGMATYVRLSAASPEAEGAFVMADRLRGHGLGTRMLELLVEVAREHDIQTFTAHVLGENRRMLEVFRQCGFPLTTTTRAGEYVVTLRSHALPPAPRIGHSRARAKRRRRRCAGSSSPRASPSSAPADPAAVSGLRSSTTCRCCLRDGWYRSTRRRAWWPACERFDRSRTSRTLLIWRS